MFADESWVRENHFLLGVTTGRLLMAKQSLCFVPMCTWAALSELSGLYCLKEKEYEVEREIYQRMGKVERESGWIWLR